MNRKVFIAVIAALLVAVLITVAVTVNRNAEETETDPPTARPPVVLQRPTETVAGETENEAESETDSPPPYVGMAFTMLIPDRENLFFGESDQGNEVNFAAYERNLLLCEELGISFVFQYSLGVYEEFSAMNDAGKAEIDLICANMQSDGAQFMMNGGLDDVFSAIDPDSDYLCESFREYFTFAERSFFLVGDATPSYPLATRFLRVNKTSSVYEKLKGLAESGSLTYDALFTVLKEDSKILALDEESFHSLASPGGIFHFSDEGTPSIDTEIYVSNVSALIGYKDSTSEYSEGDSIPEISVGAPVFGEYLAYLPLPKTNISDEYVATADPSCLYSFAVPENLSNREKTYAVIDRMFELSEGLPEAVCADYGIEFSDINEKHTFCFYDIFGWGDFSKHAYAAFLASDANNLKTKLTAPEKAALQALAILFERCS